MDFFDKDGAPAIYSEDGKWFYTWEGKHVAFVQGVSLHNLDGKHIGWLKDGWISDKAGYPLMVSADPSGAGPPRPTASEPPPKEPRKPVSIAHPPDQPPTPPQPQSSWSKLTLDQFLTGDFHSENAIADPKSR